MLALHGLLLSTRLLRQTAAELNGPKELHAARLAFIKDRTAASDRGKTLTEPLLKRHNAARLKQIEARLVQVDQAIMVRIAADEALKTRFDIIVSIPGLSTIAADALLIEMPELGELEDKAAAALSGLAPRDRPSGRRAGRASIAGGRAIVRRARSTPSLVAIRFNPDLKAKYDQLTKAGKPPKVAITAIMRKLVVLANALLLQGRKWRPNAD